MKFLPFKILFLCILIPPVLFLFTLHFSESYLKKKYTEEIEEICTGDTYPLFKGTITLRDAIKKNISIYLKNKLLITWGVQTNIIIETKTGIRLFPFFYQQDSTDFYIDKLISIASENYTFLKDGILVKVDIIIPYDTKISYFIFSFYIFISLIIIYCFYNIGAQKAEKHEFIKNRRIKGLEEKHARYAKQAFIHEQKRSKLLSDLLNVKKELEKEKLKVIKNEDEMLEEISLYEEELEKNTSLLKDQQEYIDSLKHRIKELDHAKVKEKKQIDKASEALSKRFKVLYKNILFDKRALEGFVSLESEAKIKCEEVIHHLNEDFTKVSIKRKVFSKKDNKTPSFEVLIAYKGRLYFRHTKDGKINILAIGTKTTQHKDLVYIDKL